MKHLILLSMAALLGACTVQDLGDAAFILTNLGEIADNLECNLSPGCHNIAD